MRFPTVLISFVLAYTSLTAATYAAVQPSSPPIGSRGSTASQAASNQNLSFDIRHLQLAVNHLRRDFKDYGGHRVAAIGDIEQAMDDLKAALGNSRAPSLPITGVPVAPPTSATLPPATSTTTPTGHAESGQVASNEQLRIARRHLENVIDALMRDKHDYGGKRADAITLVRKARQELDAALASR